MKHSLLEVETSPECQLEEARQWVDKTQEQVDKAQEQVEKSLQQVTQT